LKLTRAYSLEEIAGIINAEFFGDSSVEATGINEIHVVEPGDIAFVDHPKYYDKTLQSAASVILINKEVPCPDEKGLIVVDEPFTAFNTLSKHFQWQFEQVPAKIGFGSYVHPSASIGKNCVIGKDCHIEAGVVIYDNCTVGDRVTIHANSVIGGDGFYYKARVGSFEKLRSVGSVEIADDVEIGAACTIDRGVSGATSIGKMTKIDNQVHVGHDTQIGACCLIAAQVGIAGCVKIGDEVKLWGQVGVSPNVVLDDKVEVYAQSGVAKSLTGGQAYFGSPAKDAKTKMRELFTVANLSKQK